MLALPLAVPALAQGPGRPVEDVREVGGYRGWLGIHILLKTDKEDLDVHFGPTAFLAENKFTFAKGDHIEVLGSRVRVGATDALLAREAQKDSKTLVLRDANGIPGWSRAGRGCCPGPGI